jgi:sterol desaturase/sphingolipid hydroxylase (fatty acid hydroxylase superfamily)
VNPLFEWARAQSFVAWVIFSFASNVFFVAASVAGCWLLGRVFSGRPLFAAPQPLTRQDKFLAALATLLNAGVSIVGWLLWKAGWITITFTGAGRAMLDLAILLLVMDAGMYGLHWLVHGRWIYPWVHRTHHTHESTNPISLFVLNPFEVLGFGGLLVCALMVFPLSAWAVGSYLTLNLVFGTIGHAGVEPLPLRWMKHPALRFVGTSTFHAQHHADPTHNFGFYTVVWDRLFGTIHPDYNRQVFGGRAPCID